MALSSTFHVIGRYMIEILDGANAASWTELGVTENEELPRFTPQRFVRELKSNSSGEEIEDAVHLGSMGRLTLSMAKWNDTGRQILMVGAGGTGDGHAGLVGQVYSDDGSSGDDFFGFRLTPIDAAGDAITPSATRPQYTFTRCLFVDGDIPGEFRDFGNDATRLVVQATVLRDTSSNDLYAIATS